MHALLLFANPPPRPALRPRLASTDLQRNPGQAAIKPPDLCGLAYRRRIRQIRSLSAARAGSTPLRRWAPQAAGSPARPGRPDPDATVASAIMERAARQSPRRGSCSQRKTALCTLAASSPRRFVGWCGRRWVLGGRSGFGGRRHDRDAGNPDRIRRGVEAEELGYSSAWHRRG